jgi:hypothetical protein
MSFSWGGPGEAGSEPQSHGRARKCFAISLRVLMAGLLLGNALDYESFLLGVNQIIAGPNSSQTSNPISRLFQAFNGHDPNRRSVSKLFENIKFRRHFEAPA